MAQPLPFPISQLAIAVLSGQWTTKDWMPTQQQCRDYLDREFWRRVDLACIALRANYWDRGIDECYESGDGDLIMAAVLRRAKEDSRLRDAICINWPDRSKLDEIEASYAKFADHELAKLARQKLECRTRQIPLL